MTLLCITSGMVGVRTCVFRGQHLSTCQWVQGLADDAQPVRECTGCLPRPAEVGMLCRQCWEKFEAALGSSVDLITHLRSIERGAQSIDGVRSLTVVQPTYPQSWQQADALWRLLWGVGVAHAMDKDIAEPPRRHWTGAAIGFSFSATLDMVTVAVRDLVEWLSASPEDVVARTGGAEAAVTYYREMQRSLAMFPMEEKPRKRVYFRCRRCGGDVEDAPPLQQLDDRVFRCARCNDIYDDVLATWDMKVWVEDAWNSLTEDQQKTLFLLLKPDEKEVLAEVQRAFRVLEAGREASSIGTP